MSLDSLSKKLKHGMMGYNIYTKIAVNLPKIFPCWLRAISAKFGPILCNLMSHDLLSEDPFEILWHDKAQYTWLKVALVSFPKFRNILSSCGVIFRRKSYQLIVKYNIFLN